MMVPIQYRGAGRTAKEISDHLESGIRAGTLQPGGSLPSVRVLAAELAVAPGTVATAYKLLRDRGLLEARGRNGTYVRPRPALTSRSYRPPIDPGVTDLSSGQPDPDLLPDLPALALSDATAAAPPAFVLPELLALGRSRLVADGVPAEAITLSSGGLDGIQRVLSAQLHPGDQVAIEDPGWASALDLIAALGLHPVPLSVDAEGPLAAPLQAALQAGARAVIVTNRAHNPTGASLSPHRAGQLREVLAGHRRTLVIEDDHSGELADVELASLAGLTDSWAFIRSTSKPYGPDLRLALVAGDPATIARVEGRVRVGSGWVSTVLQRLVVQLWTSDSAAAAVAHAAGVYQSRRDQLIAALAEHQIASTGRSGLNVWVPVVDETTAVSQLLRAGWAVAPGARFRQVSPPGIRITVCGLTGSTIPRLAGDVARALTPAVATSYLA